MSCCYWTRSLFWRTYSIVAWFYACEIECGVGFILHLFAGDNNGIVNSATIRIDVVITGFCKGKEDTHNKICRNSWRVEMRSAKHLHILQDIMRKNTKKVEIDPPAFHQDRIKMGHIFCTCTHMHMHMYMHGHTYTCTPLISPLFSMARSQQDFAGFSRLPYLALLLESLPPYVV